MALFTPVNQIRLTNVVIVRMKKGGKRFEIACYPNKVLDWRDGKETNIDEVLQTQSVFVNVSKGSIAPAADLEAAFRTTDTLEICKAILAKGQVQVSTKEREQVMDNKFKDVATIVSHKCVNPETMRPYTVTMIEKALRDIHVNISATSSAKKQALELIPLLAAVMPIMRARMRVRVVVAQRDAKALKAGLEALFSLVEDSMVSAAGLEITGLVDPGVFRELDESLRAQTRGQGRLEIVDSLVAVEGDADILDEAA